MEFFYNKVITYDETGKISHVDFNSKLEKHPHIKCCDALEGMVNSNLLPLLSFTNPDSSQTLKLAVNIINGQQTMPLKINYCLFCGTKIIYTVIDIIKYDQRKTEDTNNNQKKVSKKGKKEKVKITKKVKKTKKQ